MPTLVTQIASRSLASRAMKSQKSSNVQWHRAAEGVQRIKGKLGKRHPRREHDERAGFQFPRDQTSQTIATPPLTASGFPAILHPAFRLSRRFKAPAGSGRMSSRNSIVHPCYPRAVQIIIITGQRVEETAGPVPPAHRKFPVRASAVPDRQGGPFCSTTEDRLIRHPLPAAFR